MVDCEGINNADTHSRVKTGRVRKEKIAKSKSLTQHKAQRFLIRSQFTPSLLPPGHHQRSLHQ